MPAVPLGLRPLTLGAVVAVLAAGVALVVQVKRADVASSERDRLIHAQIRQVSETTALTLRHMDMSGRALTTTLLRRAANIETAADHGRIQASLHAFVREHPEVLSLRASHGDQSWSIQRDTPAPRGASPGDAADTNVPRPAGESGSDGTSDERDRPDPGPGMATAGTDATATGDDATDAAAPTPANTSPRGRRPWTPARAIVPDSSLRRIQDEDSTAQLVASFEGRLRGASVDGDAWTFALTLDADPPLSPLSRAPGRRLGHLAILGEEGQLIWGPTQRYDDGGSGWLELDDAAVREACARWLAQGSPADRLVPYTHDGHVFAVGGRTAAAFENTTVKICVMMPRRDFAHLQ